MKKVSTLIIGGGAAGIVAAISAKRQGGSVLLCERMPRLGKKILASGGGRCNLLNDNLDASYYSPAAQGLVKSVFSKFGKEDIRKFFKDLGLETYSEEGRVFPVTNQSSSVIKVLEMELARLAVPVESNCDIASISDSRGCFIVSAKTGLSVSCEKVIIAGGGKSYPALGSDGNTYSFARQFGHRIVEPVPCAVALTARDPLCHLLQGQRICARAKSLIGGRIVREAEGELIFTKYGLSGTAIIDISEEVSVAIHRQKEKDASVVVDMVPFLSKDELKRELSRRIERKFPPEDLLAGILPNKFGVILKNYVDHRAIDGLIESLKERRFMVTGTRGWNEAEFTAGGVDPSEVEERTLESKKKKGLYLAGEILDVGGRRGGYHLAWAWASGYVAGCHTVGLPVGHTYATP